MPQAGDHLGEFELIREVGRGAMGVVYEARQASLGRRVAVKVLSAAAAGDPVWVERFRAEASAAARLSHASILPVFAVGVAGGAGGLPWFAMEFVEGRDLSDLIKGGSALGPREAARIVRDAALALDHAHGQGVIHRDVKPSNLMVRADGRVAVTDFGLAKHVGSGSLTTSGSLLGTPFYMSPEQTLGDRDAIGPPTDIYGLGATLYECLTGQPPFTGDNPVALLRQIAEKDPVPPGKVSPGVPRDLETITLRCLEKKRERRYPSCLELAADLDRYLRGDPIGSHRPGPVERARRWVLRNRVASAALGGALLVLGLGAWLFTHTLENREDDLKREVDQRIAEARQAIQAGNLSRAEELLGGLAGDDRASEDQQKKIDVVEGEALAAAVEAVSQDEDPTALEATIQKFQGHARGGKAVALVGSARVSVRTEPAGAALTAQRLGSEGETRSLPNPASDLPVPLGIYRVTATAPGRVPLATTFALLEPRGRVFVEMRLPLPEEVPAGMVAVGGQIARAPARKDQAATVYDLPTFLLDRTEVTVAQYQRFLASLPTDEERAAFLPVTWRGGRPPAGSTQLPVTGVTWDQADEFAGWAGKRLPMQQEIELATFGYSSAVVPTAIQKRLEEARKASDGRSRPNTLELARRSTLPVDRPDAFVSASGAADLLGNAAEWTALSPPGDPWRAQVVGGSYEEQIGSRVTARLANDPSLAVGFRCAKSMPRPRPLPPLPALASTERVARRLRVETSGAVIESFVARVENPGTEAAVERELLACEGPSSIGFRVGAASAPGRSVRVERVETTGPVGSCQRRVRLRFAPPLAPGEGVDVTLEEERIPLEAPALFVRLGSRFDLLVDATQGVEVTLPEHAELLRAGSPAAVVGAVDGRSVVRVAAGKGGMLHLEALVPDAPRADASARRAAAETARAWDDLRTLDGQRFLDLLAPEYHSDHFQDRARVATVFEAWRKIAVRADLEWKTWGVAPEGERLVIRRTLERLSLVLKDGKVGDGPLTLPKMLVSYLRRDGEGPDAPWRIAEDDVLAFSEGIEQRTPDGGWVHESFGLRVDAPFGARLHPVSRGIADLAMGFPLSGRDGSFEVSAFSRVDESSGIPMLTRATLERYGYQVVSEKAASVGGLPGTEFLVGSKAGERFHASRRRAVRRGEGAVLVTASCASPRSLEEALGLLVSHQDEIDKLFAAVHASK